MGTLNKLMHREQQPHQEFQYLNLLKDVLENGESKTDRTGTGTRSVFGRQIRFDLEKEFPLLTTKRVPFGLVRDELLWFLVGQSNIQPLVQKNNHIWDDWPYKHYNQEVQKQGLKPYSQEEFISQIKDNDDFAQKWGELGPVYGVQWRSWKTPDGQAIDQIQKMIDQIKTTPDSRRLIVSAWNVADIDEMAKAGLPPCHTMFQFYVLNDKLSCQMYQRSGDMFLGVPFNIASYALLTMMMAQVTGYKPGEFIHTFGDAHIYNNHVDQVKEQLSRDPHPFPQMKINPEVKDIFSFKSDDFTLEGYDPHPSIKASVAV